jgi:hypothetical protein
MANQDVPPESPSPPRAFTQGVGTVFQFVGVTLFCLSMFICCASSLLSKDYATHTSLTTVGWHLPGDPPDRPTYSAQRATTTSLMAAIFFGMALAGVGLGLQAQNRWAPPSAVLLTLLATAFWLVHAVFFATAARWIVLPAICGLLTISFAILLGFAIAALREFRGNPPPVGHEILPPGYQVPYSHLHKDPPDVRLAQDLEQRRQRLAVQQKELEMLEEKIRRRMEEPRDS